MSGKIIKLGFIVASAAVSLVSETLKDKKLDIKIDKLVDSKVAERLANMKTE